MNIAKLFALSFALLTGACAGPLRSGTALDFDRRLDDCSHAHHYADGEIALISRMRDDGDGLSDVARRVGGTRQDVRCAELIARARRRGQELPSFLVNASAPVADGATKTFAMAAR